MVLACREQAIKALRERLAYLAGTPDLDIGAGATLTSLTHRPVQHLAGVLDTLPRPRVAPVPPSQLLSAHPAHAQQRARPVLVECWRQAARGLLLGTAELTRADQQPWTHQPAAGWHLVGDAATTLEALLVLDDRLTTAGQLRPTTPDHGRGRRRDRLAQRLITTQAVRLAAWYGTDPTPDLATSGVRHDLGVGGHPPVVLVRGPGDFARAQRSLTALLHGHADLLRPGSHQRSGLLAARALSTGQIRLAQAFAGWADHAAQPDLAEQFRSRIPAFRELHTSTTRLAEVEKRRSPLLLAQQSEMVIALRSPTTGTARLTAEELRDLDRATHELTVTFGRTLRHEAIGSHNIVALDAETLGLPTAQPMTSTGWAFTAACQHLADQPPTTRRRALQAPQGPRQRERCGPRWRTP